MDGNWRNNNGIPGVGGVKKRGPRFRSSHSANRSLNQNHEDANYLRGLLNPGSSRHVSRYPQQTTNDPFDSDEDERPTSHRSHARRPTTPNPSMNRLSSLLSQTSLHTSGVQRHINPPPSNIPSLLSNYVHHDAQGRNSQHLNQRGNHGRGGKQNTRLRREGFKSSTSSIPSLFDDDYGLPPGGRNSPHLNQRGKNHRGGGNQNFRSTSSIPTLFDDYHDLQRGRGRSDRRGRGHDRRNDGGERNHDNDEKRPFKRKYPLGFQKLQEILSDENPDNVLKALSENFDALLLLLEKPSLSPDCISLLLQAVVKIANSYFESHIMKILHRVVDDNFIQQLITFITQLPLHDARDKQHAGYFWKNPEGFFSDLNIFCETVIKVIPSKGVSILPKLIKAVHLTLQNLDIDDDVLEKYEDLEVFVVGEIEKFHKKHEKQINPSAPQDDLPPDDFRLIPVYPESIEITTPLRPFLRANIVDGGYASIEHYLDVQFRLVRNDFVKPLRDGLLAFLNPEQSKRPQNIKVYKGVKFLQSEMCSGSSNGYLIQLPKPKKNFQLKLENSRMFMFGSLVCFTNDYFKTIIFGRIADRKVELLKASQLVVSLHHNTELVDSKGEYLMVESKVYFEPYYHVLTALQQLHEDDFPMKQYIVDTLIDDRLPEYFTDVTVPPSISKYSIPITNGAVQERNWPLMSKLQLNEAQYRAYKNALTRKFSIIQGPPGTGKTHLGLVVGKALLYNHKIWHQGQHPMMVICFTNHALDQFLEGLLKSTTEIVRIGGQSKNKNLDQYNLRNIRKKSHNRLINQNFLNFKDSANSLKKFYDILNAAREYKGIINLKPLLDTLPDTWPVQRLQNLCQEEFKKWLLGGKIQKKYTLNIDDFIAAQNAEQENASSGSDEDFEDAEDEAMLKQLIEEEDNNNIDNDDILNFDCTRAPIYIVTLKEYINRFGEIREEVAYLKRIADNDALQKLFDLENEDVVLQEQYGYLEQKLNDIKNAPTQDNIPHDLMRQLRNPDNIDPEDRWILYNHWVKMYEKQVKKQMKEAEDEYQIAYKELEDARMMVDIEMLRTKMVIGMTTTGAARLQTVLKALRSRVVIVEEAAEIMEAHIITSLTKHCEHIILIGDHQQLRPSTADYVMETKYNLGISLFERMIRNKVECNVLEIQHRMRPEFAKLIVPTIYPVLHNHESVYNFPEMRGVQKNLYFINHTNAENKEKDDSKFNMFEVEYIIRLAQYLILNGYEPQDVTILCAYSAQLFKMFAERKNFPLLRDVRICVLDNYQGEESKVILLSLVRNNPENNVGFLKIDNRVCVALSRAREGFYIMGNIRMLSQASQDIWGNIQKTLEEQGSLGDSIPLSCEIHGGKITRIKSINDFQKVVEGGCDEVCNILLQCGHFCKMQCHTRNRDHKESTCREKCTKILCQEEHPCPKRCFEKCDLCMVPMRRSLPCGHTGIFPCSDQLRACKEIVSVILACGHTAHKHCHLPIVQVKCPHPCDVRVESCGHACALLCHINIDPDHLEYKCRRPCNKERPGCKTKLEEHRCKKQCFQECEECDINVKKYRSCGHVYSMKCSESVELMHCSKPCKEKLPCGHDCKQECSDPCGNCMVEVKKKVEECGHVVKIACKDPPTKNKCKGKCPLMLPCGHQCQKKCKDSCTTDCKALIKSVSPLPCGHYADIPCSLNTTLEITSNSSLLSYCKTPCKTTLKCDHPCGGNCGDCFQGRIHKVCSSDCGVPLVCGHVCKTPCRAECPPCDQKCQVRCPHTKCGKKCGEVCTKCIEPCARKCLHQACDNRCEEICSVDPCNKPCLRFLKCTHPCIGFCGDPCPKLCRICDKDEVTEILFGNEDEPDARFVLLEDCQHVIESEGMDEWMKVEKEGEIKSKVCPKCKTPIFNTRRYGDYIKESLQNVMDVKKKFYGDLGENIRIGKDQIRKLDDLCRKSALAAVCPLVTHVQKVFETQLKPTKERKRQMLTRLTVNSTIAKIQILENICNLYQTHFGKVNAFNIMPKNQTPNRCLNYINFLLLRLITEPERMTQQEVDDFQLELKRLRRIIQFTFVSDRLPTYKRQSQEYIKLDSQIYSLTCYDDKHDTFIKKSIEELHRSTGGLDVSEAELKQIIQVIGVKSGGWYKCPNGHLYAIGECGGAMQHGTCPDCGSAIGGGNHQLAQGNAHANVDGSRYAAWSEQANMLNYRFNLD